MERNIFDEKDEFESFLKEKANQYKLYPSDKVWDGVYNFFHSTRKWYTLTGTALLFTTLFFINLQLSTDHKEASGVPVTDSLRQAGRVPLLSDLLLYDQETALPAMAAADAQHLLLAGGAGNLFAGGADNLFAREAGSLFVGQAGNLLAGQAGNPDSRNPVTGTGVQHSPATSAVEAAMTPPAIASGYDLLPPQRPAVSMPGVVNNPAPSGKSATGNQINWLQEMAAIRLSARSQQRFGLQFYLSPTAGYRRLRNHREEVNTKLNNISPLSGDLVNIDGIVDHHPAIGLELGSSLLLNASKKLVLKAGLQFNYVRYSIQAYKSYPEKTAITLSSAGPHIYNDTITAYTSIRNLSGRYPENLQNQYAQISLPIGAELKLLGDNRFQINVAGTIQPTYLLYNSTYLLTSDYGNYTRDPGLVRKWNVNAAIESYISYRAGGLRWQLGPQFRYQLLSTYNDLYPIREYLMEYGVKIGVSKTLK